MTALKWNCEGDDEEKKEKGEKYEPLAVLEWLSCIFSSVCGDTKTAVVAGSLLFSPSAGPSCHFNQTRICK